MSKAKPIFFEGAWYANTTEFRQSVPMYVDRVPIVRDEGITTWEQYLKRFPPGQMGRPCKKCHWYREGVRHEFNTMAQFAEFIGVSHVTAKRYVTLGIESDEDMVAYRNGEWDGAGGGGYAPAKIDERTINAIRQLSTKEFRPLAEDLKYRRRMCVADLIVPSFDYGDSDKNATYKLTMRGARVLANYDARAKIGDVLQNT